MLLRVGTAFVAIALILLLLWYLPEQIVRQWLVALLFCVLTYEWLAISGWSNATNVEKALTLLFALVVGVTVCFVYTGPDGMGPLAHWTIFLLWVLSCASVNQYERIRSFLTRRKNLYRIIGILLVGGGLHALGTVFLNTTIIAFVGLLTIVWLTDSGAYLVGKMFGKRPFYNNVSPNKTLEGAIGGCVIGFMWSILFFNLDDSLPDPMKNFILSLAIVIFAVYGDLFVSGMKRIGGVKDSGRLFPGHGGALDRFDSILPAFACIAMLVPLFP